MKIINMKKRFLGLLVYSFDTFEWFSPSGIYKIQKNCIVLQIDFNIFFLILEDTFNNIIFSPYKKLQRLSVAFQNINLCFFIL